MKRLETQAPCRFHGHFSHYENEYRILKNGPSAGKIVGLYFSSSSFATKRPDVMQVGWGTKLKETQ